MAYKLTSEQKEVANFIRTLNLQIEKSAKTFGNTAEITNNLINLGTQFGLQTVSKKSKLGVIQFTSGKTQLNKILNGNTFANLKAQFYTKNGDIRKIFNVAKRKVEFTREMKYKKENYTYQEYEIIKSINTKVAEKYDDFITSYVDENSYKKWNKILSHLRSDKITNNDLKEIEKMEQNKKVIIGSNIVDKSTGEIVGTLRDDTIYDYTK